MAGNSAALADIGPEKLLVPSFFFLMALFALAIALLGPRYDRAKRSLALLIVLIASLGIFSQLLPLPLGSGLSLAIFLGIYAVFYLMGKFDAPDK